MATAEKKESRVDVRYSIEEAIVLDRAAALSGRSKSEISRQATLNTARQIIQEHVEITIANEQFDNFAAACSELDRQPNSRLKSYADRLDREGL